MVALYVYSANKLLGDYVSAKLYLNVDDYVVTYLYTIFFYLFSFGLFVFFDFLTSCNSCGIKNNKFPSANKLMLLLLIMNLYFIKETDVGIMHHSNEITVGGVLGLIGYICAILRVNFIFYIYAAIEKNKNHIYWLNVILFLGTELMRGVTFPILLVIAANFSFFIKRISKIWFLIISILSVKVINVIYNIKYEVRLGSDVEPLSLYDSTMMLFGRFSTYSNSLFYNVKLNPISDFFGKNENLVSVYSEFFQRLSPFPSLFLVDQNKIEYGKLIFSYFTGYMDSSNAMIYPTHLYMLSFSDAIFSVILMSIYLFVCLLSCNHIFNSNMELKVVIFLIFIFFVTQSFYGLMASFIYAMVIYMVLFKVVTLISAHVIKIK